MHSIFRPTELVNVREFSVDTIQKISISYISESITFYETDKDMLVLKEYYNESDPELFAQTEQNENEIIIRHGQRPKMFNLLRGYVELYVPKQYFGVLNAKTISGKLETTGRMVLSELTMSNTSGKIVVADVMSGRVVLSSVSGSVEVSNMKAVASIHSTSGSIRVANADGDGNYKSVSGSIDVTYRAVTGDIVAGSTSGRVRLTLPELLSFAVEAHSVSGSVHVPFKGMLAGARHAVSGNVGDHGQNAQVQVKARTVSGRIEILPG